MTADDLRFDCAMGFLMTNANIVIAVVMLVRLVRLEADFADKKIDLLKDYATTQVNTLHERIDKLEQDQEEGRAQ